jgi:hypothetical protein
MRTLFLFALTLAGIVALADDASALGRRNRRADPCCNGYGTVAYTTACCGQPRVAYAPNYGPAYASNPVGSYPTGSCCDQSGVVYGGTYGARAFGGRRYKSYSMGPVYSGGMYQSGYYSPTYSGGVYQSGYYTPVVPGQGVIPAGGTIDPNAPRQVPKPMPDK